MIFIKNQLHAYEGQHPDDFLCLYFSQTLQDLYGYLELFVRTATDPVQLNIDEFILSVISEDFLIDFHELESISGNSSDIVQNPTAIENKNMQSPGR